MMEEHARTRRARRFAVCVCGLALAVTACASGGGFELGSPEALPALEARLAQDSTDVDAMVGVAAAYRSTGRPTDARVLLERARAIEPEHGVAAVLLGLMQEDLQDYDAALAVYSDYLEIAQSAELREQIRRRIPLVERAELIAEVEAAVEREGTVTEEEPSPYTVAIYPYILGAANDSLQPLGRAVAEWLATDLARSGRITVVERTALRVLQEELDLQQSVWVDQATAQRTGQLLRAGVVVQGRIDGGVDRLVIETAIVDAIRGTGDPDELSHEGAMDALWALERQLALEIIESVGIELTPAERERIASRPTENLQALLAYGRGLEAADAGQFEQAAAHFAEAVRLDDGFDAARASADRATDAAAAGATSTDQLASQAGQEALATDPLSAVEALVPPVGGRDAAQEALGSEGLGRRTVLEIIIRGN
jgi:tetratricopeptide (TPR) repeat protein